VHCNIAPIDYRIFFELPENICSDEQANKLHNILKYEVLFYLGELTVECINIQLENGV